MMPGVVEILLVTFSMGGIFGAIVALHLANKPDDKNK